MGAANGHQRTRAGWVVVAAAALAVVGGCGTVAGVGERADTAVAGSAGTGSVMPFPAPVSMTGPRSSPSSSSPPAPAPPSSPGPAAGSGHGAAPTSTPPGALNAAIDAATTADPAHYVGIASPVGFQSPSGNIRCGFQYDGAGYVVCSIDHFAADAPTVTCQGHQEPPNGVGLAAGTGAAPMWKCLSDVETGGPTLPYGSSLTVGDITCASQRDGVTCVDTGSGTGRGDGFRLARESYQLVPDLAAGAASPTETDAPQPSSGDPAGGTGDHAPAPSGRTTSTDSPVGHVFWADSSDPRPGSALVIGFQDSRWAYGNLEHGIPECTSAGLISGTTAECVPYRFDQATGALSIGPDSRGNTLNGTYHSGAMTLEGKHFGALYIPAAGATFQAAVHAGSSSGQCGSPGGCSATSIRISFERDGTFAVSGGSADSTGVVGVFPELGSSTDLDGTKGTYRIAAGGRLELTIAGQSLSVFVGEVVGSDGRPRPDGPQGAGGLLLGSTYFWHEGGN